MIYADNAATTKLDKDALAAMLPWLQDEYGNASQPYSFARKPKQALGDARALKGVMFEFGDGRAMLTSQIEHHAVLHSAEAIERMGFPVAYMPVNAQGILTADILRRHITDHTKLVSVMMVNNEIGTIEPIEELVTIAHKHGSLFHTDAVQAVGHIPVDVKSLGIGFLYIKKGTKIFPFADGGAQESHMRAGTENIASVVGMAVALQKNCKAMQETSLKLQMMENVFVKALRDADIDFIRNGSENRVPGNINISIRNASGEMLLHRLDLKGISISTGSACDSVNMKVSHVIKAISTPDEYAEGTIRVSFGCDNKMEDAFEVANAIVHILRN